MYDKKINRFKIIPTLYSAGEEHFYKSPDRLRLPLIFYLAHTATLHVNKMMLAGLITVNLMHRMQMCVWYMCVLLGESKSAL